MAMFVLFGQVLIKWMENRRAEKASDQTHSIAAQETTLKLVTTLNSEMDRYEEELKFERTRANEARDHVRQLIRHLELIARATTPADRKTAEEAALLYIDTIRIGY
ncbi:hypothetical protein [Aurantiacibacter arachoides]|nr:hypothetical protein [Aurantiacibacter arachoides]